jgi:hypothetical protein
MTKRSQNQLSPLVASNQSQITRFAKRHNQQGTPNCLHQQGRGRGRSALARSWSSIASSLSKTIHPASPSKKSTDAAASSSGTPPVNNGTLDDKCSRSDGDSYTDEDSAEGSQQEDPVEEDASIATFSNLTQETFKPSPMSEGPPSIRDLCFSFHFRWRFRIK